jgi:undecaprenyl-phosphate galactose phosphotransferase
MTHVGHKVCETASRDPSIGTGALSAMTNFSELQGFDHAHGAATGTAVRRSIDLHGLVKRTIDLGLTLVLLFGLSPLLLVLWAVCRLDGGPGVYGHVRVGRHGRPFRCLKFRSMVVDAEAVLARHLEACPQARIEWATTRKLTDDPRITAVGRLLRATSFDELPQLFNVLLGDMSLVGPRPVVQAELDAFFGRRGAAAYLSVRPGLTGLWQVSGRSDVDYPRRVALDMTYVRDASFLLDAQILLRTVRVVLLRKGAR